MKVIVAEKVSNSSHKVVALSYIQVLVSNEAEAIECEPEKLLKRCVCVCVCV
jgi:hypothetical protein